MSLKRFNRWLNRKTIKRTQANLPDGKIKEEEVLGEHLTKKCQGQENIYNYGIFLDINKSPEVSGKTTEKVHVERKEIEISSGEDNISNHDDILGVNNESGSTFKGLNNKSQEPTHNKLLNDNFTEHSESAIGIRSKYGTQRQEHEINLQKIGTYGTEAKTIITIKGRENRNKSDAAPEDDLDSMVYLNSEKDVGLISRFEEWSNQTSSDNNLTNLTTENSNNYKNIKRLQEQKQEKIQNKNDSMPAISKKNTNFAEGSGTTVTNEEDETTSNTETDFASSYNYTSGMEGGFNINLNFTGEGWSHELIQEAESMAELLSTLIIGDIPDEEYKGNIVDDLSLNLELGSLDGEGNVLGHAGIREWRQESELPLIAEIFFDVADSEQLLDQDRFDDLVLHEMIHTLGFISTNKSLISLIDKENFYIGMNGVNEYQKGVENGVYKAENGLLTNWDSGFHWDNMGPSLQTNEIMSANIHGINHLSTVTLGVIEDLGYQTILGDNQPIDTQVLLHEVTSNWTSNNEWR